MHPSHDILIHGAGPVGLACALALSRQGLKVAYQGPEVATAVPAAAKPDLRAYALNPASVHLLQSLKVWEAMPAAARCAVADMRIEGDAAGAWLEFSAWQQAVDELAFIVDAGALNHALVQALSFAPHISAIRANAPAPTAALTVVAQGRQSPAREALGVKWVEQPYGHSAVAARLCSDVPHAGLARQWFQSPGVLALLPMNLAALANAPHAQAEPLVARAAQAGAFGLVWSVPDAQADALMALDGSAFATALNEATQGAAGQLLLAGERARWPLHHARAQQVAGPGWVLVGDAAHVVHPLAGQGLNLGLADVSCLARVLAQRETWRALGDEKLLARHAREREAAVRAMGLVTDGLLHLFAHPSPWVKDIRNRGLGMVQQLAPLKRLLAGQALGR